VLDDGEVEYEIAASLHTVTPRLFKGHSMCNEKACLQRKTCKLKNATDVVQDYLDELSNRGKQAAEVGRPDSAAAHGDNAVGHMIRPMTYPFRQKLSRQQVSEPN